MAMRRCEKCDTPIRGKRADARTCSAACRQALYRAGTGDAIPAGLIAMWRELRLEYGDDVTVPRIKRAAVKRLERLKRDHKAAEMRLVKERFENGVCDSCGATGGWEGLGVTGNLYAGWTKAILPGEPWSRMWCPECRLRRKTPDS